MAVTSFQKFGYKIFGKSAAKQKNLAAVQDQLIKARLDIRAEMFLAHASFMGLLAAFGTAIIGATAIAYLTLVVGRPMIFWALLPLIPVIGWYIGVGAVKSDAPSKARKRGKEIDTKLGYATNYIAALSSAGVIPSEIFRSLARQPIYGAVRDEAAFIYKDMEVHGLDILTAMRRGMDRTPSRKFQDLMQGALTTIASGGDLTTYFRGRAARLHFEQRIEQKNFIETMGLMAESYVTAAVAGPLFLLVMVSIFVLMGGGSTGSMKMIIFGLLPILNAGFIFGLKAMTPEA